MKLRFGCASEMPTAGGARRFDLLPTCGGGLSWGWAIPATAWVAQRPGPGRLAATVKLFWTSFSISTNIDDAADEGIRQLHLRCEPALEECELPVLLEGSLLKAPPHFIKSNIFV